MAWAVFLASAAVIVYAGTKLSRYGDQIANLTGLGGLWIGVVLMAGATSLPEIFTDVSAALMRARSRRGRFVRQQHGQHAHSGHH